MHIREATLDDNAELIELQARCPQGTTVIVSTVNTPDFFARAKCYEDYKIYAVCEDTQIIASAACALRSVLINDKIEKVGYEFQAFVAPEYRGRRIAGQLHHVREEYLKKQGAVLSYGLIMEGNTPSIRHVTRQGFRRYRTVVMPTISVFKEMALPSQSNIRSVIPEDLPAVANLLNTTWQGYDFPEPVTAESLERLLRTMPEYGYESVFVLEDSGEIVACLGFLDWSQIMQITVKALSLKMRAVCFALDIIGKFRPIPRGPKPGDILKQMVLTPIGFKDAKDIAVLLRYVNNQALKKGIQQIFFLCERRHPLLDGLKGFIHIDTTMHLYIKPLQENPLIISRPVFVNGLDL